MMRRWWTRHPSLRCVDRLIGRLALVVVLLLGATPPALAGLVDVLPRIKSSVVAVGTFQRTRSPAFLLRGTGFAVGDGSLIATNAHVVPVLLSTDAVEELIAIVVGPNGEQSHRKLTKYASDPTHDLALLRLEGPPLPPLTLGDPARVQEGQPIALTGFPIVGVLGAIPATHHGIVSALTPAVQPQANSALLNPNLIGRIRAGGFRVFQLDATAYPGNSGSPVFDPETGEVLAIVNSVFVKAGKESALTDPSGISYAIPVNFLKAMVGGK